MDELARWWGRNPRLTVDRGVGPPSNFQLHLPHYAVTTDDPQAVQVLARQPIDVERPHPFTAAGNTEFNSFLWMQPKDARLGHILLADSTVFTTLFGGTESLANFWRNIATRLELATIVLTLSGLAG